MSTKHFSRGRKGNFSRNILVFLGQSLIFSEIFVFLNFLRKGEEAFLPLNNILHVNGTCFLVSTFTKYLMNDIQKRFLKSLFFINKCSKVFKGTLSKILMFNLKKNAYSIKLHELSPSQEEGPDRIFYWISWRIKRIRVENIFNSLPIFISQEHLFQPLKKFNFF